MKDNLNKPEINLSLFIIMTNTLKQTLNAFKTISDDRIQPEANLKRI